MANRTFTKDFLVDELELPYDSDKIKINEIVDTTRWSILYDLVFEFEGKFYRTSYSVGATESQDESPWEYVAEVECHEVIEVPVITTEWVSVS